MNSLVIIHFHPIEQYPPVLNLMDFIVKSGGMNNVSVITCGSKRINWKKQSSDSSVLKIFRVVNLNQGEFRLYRYFKYFKFYLFSLFFLIFKRPKSILAYDAVSILPVFLYRKLINKKCKILIHFHEYVSLEEIKSSSLFFQFLFRIERSLIPKCFWVSHTNADRLRKYLEMNHPGIFVRSHVLPNYPPKSWRRSQIKKGLKFPIKIVYVGSLSLDTMYLEEFANWLLSQGSNYFIWDIFSPNPDKAALEFLNGLDSECIKYHPPVEYSSLPDLFLHYDVGVVLYKGHIPNFVYNAPNKLFEYHVCGLDVWFPAVMEGCIPYKTLDTYPKILAVDFENLHSIDIHNLIYRENMSPKISRYCCEDVLAELINSLDNS